jgi:hypothetical protein
MTERPVPAKGSRSLTLRLAGSTWFKVAIAVGIVLLLIHFNRLDWRVLSGLRHTWPWLLLALILMLPPFLIVSYRLKVILGSQGISATFAQALRWSMIGSFFDLAMPSSNGGDVVKAGLIAAHVGAGYRTRAVMAVAFDRVLGLVGLFLLASVAGVAGWSVVRRVPGSYYLLAASFGASVGVLFAFRVLGARRLYNNPWLNQYLGTGKWGSRFKQLVRSFNALRERPAYLAIALSLSMANHVFWCASLICIARAIGNSVPVIEGFVVFPLAIFGNIFGFAGGFGIGTVGFDFLLSVFLGIGNGALIGLLFQSLSALSKLAGLPFFLASNRAGIARNGAGM